MPEEWTKPRILYVKDNVDVFQKEKDSVGFLYWYKFSVIIEGYSRNTHWELKEPVDFFLAHCVGIGAKYFARLGLNWPNSNLYIRR